MWKSRWHGHLVVMVYRYTQCDMYMSLPSLSMLLLLLLVLVRRFPGCSTGCGTWRGHWMLRPKPQSTTSNSAPTTAVSVSLQDFSEIALPSSAWSLQCSSHNRLIIIKVKEQSTSTQLLVISHSIVLQSDLSWQLNVNGHEIEAAKFASLSRFPARMSTPSTLSQLLSGLDRLTVCSEHPDVHFVSMAKAKKGKFVSSHGELTAFLDTHTGPDTVRTATCQMLTPSTVSSMRHIQTDTPSNAPQMEQNQHKRASPQPHERKMVEHPTKIFQNTPSEKKSEKMSEKSRKTNKNNQKQNHSINRDEVFTWMNPSMQT